MEPQLKSISIRNMYLDLANPRHDPVEAEVDAIHHLINKESVKALARDIAQRGLSPLEVIAVAPHPTAKGFYIPAEGNRRICALKLLEDPDRAPTEADKRYFRTLRESMPTPITSFQARVFPSKAAARGWISLRHEGEQGGVGTKKWGSTEKARFNMDTGSPTNPNAQALLLLDYALKRKLIKPEEHAAIGVTTLTRYLSNPVFRDTVGLQNRNDLTITVNQDEFDHAIKRFLSDVADPKSGVGSRTTAAERKEYAAQLRTDGDAPATRGLTPREAGAAQPSAPASKENGKATAATRNSRSRDKESTVIPPSFKASLKNHPVLKRLYDELRKTDAGEFPFSATYLLRAVIEQAAVAYLKQQCKGKAIPRDLHVKIERLEKQLEAEGLDDSDRKYLRIMSQNRDSSASADTMGHFVHGGSIPSKHDIFRTWDNIAHAMAHIFKNLK